MSAKKEEISLKDLVLKLQGWWIYLLGKWKIIVPCGLLGAILGFTYASFQKKVYTADLSFALEEKTSPMGAAAGLASQFGLDMGKGDNSMFAGDNLIELFKSRHIIENAMLTEVTIENKKDLLLNRYIRFNKLDEAWEKSEELSDLKFDKAQSRETYTLKQDSVLKAICDNMRNDPPLKVERIDKKVTIIAVSFKSEDQLFAKYFTEQLVKNVSEFYVETKTKKLKANVALLQSRVDSVRTALDAEMYGAALTQDQNQNPARIQVRVPYAKKQMNVQILTALYSELIKNLELSKLTLMREEPLIQVIDKPMFPLKGKKPGRLTSLIIGGFLGGFAILLWLVLARLFRIVMNEDDETNGSHQPKTA